MIFVKSCKFSLCLFLHKTNFETVIDDHPVSKKRTPKLHDMEFTELPNYIFPKGLTHDFGQLEFSSACF